MWRVWRLFDPLRALGDSGRVPGSRWAVMIHLVLLSTAKFNWLDGPNVKMPRERSHAGSGAEVVGSKSCSERRGPGAMPGLVGTEKCGGATAPAVCPRRGVAHGHAEF